MSKAWAALFLSAAVFLAGCACREEALRTVLPVSPEPPAPVRVMEAASPAPPDLASLERILRRTQALQPGAAGASLRLADLAGELLAWLEANPGAAEALEGRKVPLPEPMGTRALGALRAAAAAMDKARWEAWLEDAGREAAADPASRAALCALLDALLGKEPGSGTKAPGARIRLSPEAPPTGNIQKSGEDFEYFSGESLQERENSAMIALNILDIQRIIL